MSSDKRPVHELVREADEKDEKEKKKKRTPEERKARAIQDVRSSLYRLSNYDVENREDVSFILTLFDSLYFSKTNPNFLELFKKSFMGE